MSWQYRKRVNRVIRRAKNSSFGYDFPSRVPVYNEKGIEVGWLQPITQLDITNSHAKRLARWRKENAFAFPTQFRVTVPGTKKWLQEQVLDNPERILFYLYSNEKKREPIGHMGLASFDFRNNGCELDNVVRGNKSMHRGLMSMGVRALINWTKTYLKPKHIFLRVMRENEHAIVFYEKLGFKLLNKKNNKDIKLVKMIYEQEK